MNKNVHNIGVLENVIILNFLYFNNNKTYTMIIIALIFFTVLFLALFFIKNQDSLRDVESEDSIEPGLTELDYVPEEEIKKKKDRGHG